MVAIDPEYSLLPALQGVLLDPGIRPAWITRQHPRSSLRLNLLAVPPIPGPDCSPEIGALHLALTSALPLFEHFLARLGLTPWSTLTGGVLIRDLALGLLLEHHRARLSSTPPPPAPTPAAIYARLEAGADLRPLLSGEAQAWSAPTLARAAEESAAAAETWAQARTLIEAGAAHWETVPLAVQHDVHDHLRALLQPLFEAPGLGPLWQASTPASTYFNGQPAPLTLTHLLPPDPTERDQVLASWYGEYLLLAVIAAAHTRVFASVSGPPLLVLLDGLRAWWHGTALPVELAGLGSTGISCAATDTHLPPAPDGKEILQSFGTWWLHTLTPADQGVVTPHLATTHPTAGDLPLAHFPPNLALLRTAVPGTQIPTITTAEDAGWTASSFNIRICSNTHIQTESLN